MRKNPFDKYVKNELAIHKSIADYLNYQYPDKIGFHTPNESRKTAFERFITSITYVKPGVPDFMLFDTTEFISSFKILAMEVKYGNNTPTDAQIKFLDYFDGYCVWSFDSAKRIIDYFYSGSENNLYYCIIGNQMGNNFYRYNVLPDDNLPKSIIKQV